MKSPHPNPLPLNGRGNKSPVGAADPSPFQREKVARFAPDEGSLPVGGEGGTKCRMRAGRMRANTTDRRKHRIYKLKKSIDKDTLGGLIINQICLFVLKSLFLGSQRRRKKRAL